MLEIEMKKAPLLQGRGWGGDSRWSSAIGPTPNLSPEGEGLEEGFTLVELMVVLAIIGLLTTFVIVNVLPSQDVAMRRKAEADVSLIGQAVEMYRVDNMTYPRTEDGLAALTAPPATLARPDRYRSGGYLQKLPADPWGNPYQYAFPGANGRYDIYSFGADGKPGGEGDDADLGNWQQ